MTDEHKSESAAESRVQTRCAVHPQQVAIGTCSRCGNYFCDACAGRREHDQTFCGTCDGAHAYVAWEDRSLSLWDRYYRTVQSSIVALPKFAAELPARGSALRPFAFAMVPTAVSTVIGSAAFSAFAALVTDAFSSAGDAGKPTSLFIGTFMFALLGFMGLAAYVAYLVVWPSVLVLVARLFGSSHLRYSGAFRCLCYASGLNCLYFVPVVGLGVGIYHFVVASVSIAAKARTTVLLGFAIYGVPTLLSGGVCFGGYMLFVLSTIGVMD